jgi:hypothetical protein
VRRLSIYTGSTGRLIRGGGGSSSSRWSGYRLRRAGGRRARSRRSSSPGRASDDAVIPWWVICSRDFAHAIKYRRRSAKHEDRAAVDYNGRRVKRYSRTNRIRYGAFFAAILFCVAF